jgi:hypothetical protein
MTTPQQIRNEVEKGCEICGENSWTYNIVEDGLCEYCNEEFERDNGDLK